MVLNLSKIKKLKTTKLQESLWQEVPQTQCPISFCKEASLAMNSIIIPS